MRHSPGGAIRLAAPTTRPPATPGAGRGRAAGSAPARRRRSPGTRAGTRGLRARRAAPRDRGRGGRPAPQLPKRGLTTAGKSRSGSGECRSISIVRGCGSPARRSRRAVSSLSWARTTAFGPLSTRTPASSSRSSAQSPSSTPSSEWRTSSRASATSPRPSVSSASRGVSSSPGTPSQPPAASARLVGLELWATTAKRIHTGLCAVSLSGGLQSGEDLVRKWRSGFVAK